MKKAAIIISAILVFAGVAAAGALPGLSGGSNDTPTLDTTRDRRRRRPLRRGGHGTTAGGPTTTRRSRTTRVGEDISGPCDEAEHANDPRCTGAPQADDDDGRADDGDRPWQNATTAATTTAATTAAATPATAAEATTTSPSPLPPRLVAQSTSTEAAPPHVGVAWSRVDRT